MDRLPLGSELVIELGLLFNGLFQRVSGVDPVIGVSSYNVVLWHDQLGSSDKWP